MTWLCRWFNWRCDDTIQFTTIMEEVGQRPYPVARADLQNMLMDEFGRDQIYLGKNGRP